MSSNIMQPVDFYFRGGAWDSPLAAKLKEIIDLGWADIVYKVVFP